MSERPAWDDQFAETEWEKRERWKRTKQRRIAEGKCWQCAKPVAECKCPSVKHDQRAIAKPDLMDLGRKIAEAEIARIAERVKEKANAVG